MMRHQFHLKLKMKIPTLDKAIGFGKTQTKTKQKKERSANKPEALPGTGIVALYNPCCADILHHPGVSARDDLFLGVVQQENITRRSSAC
jgi:hypothetical protein